MKTYREFRPTAYDTAGLGLEDRQDWIVVPCSQTRDSGSYERSNFEVAQRMPAPDPRLIRGTSLRTLGTRLV